MQWEMMSHFNEKHKEIEKPRCYFLSSVVLCVFFFFLVVVVRMKGNSVRIIPSPAAPRPPTLPPGLPLDSLNRHVLTRVDLCCKSCYCFFFFFLSMMFGGGVLRAVSLTYPLDRSVQHGGVMLSPASADRDR